MAPETADLINKIESERLRVRLVLDAADEQVVKADEVSAQLSRELKASDAEGQAALDTLRRAGLISA